MHLVAVLCSESSVSKVSSGSLVLLPREPNNSQYKLKINCNMPEVHCNMVLDELAQNLTPIPYREKWTACS